MASRHETISDETETSNFGLETETKSQDITSLHTSEFFFYQKLAKLRKPQFFQFNSTPLLCGCSIIIVIIIMISDDINVTKCNIKKLLGFELI